MRQRIKFLGVVIFISSFSANATCQRQARAVSGQNHGQSIQNSTAVVHKESFPRPNWDMKYQSGSLKLGEGQWLKGAFAAARTSHAATPSATISQDQLREAYKEMTPILAITPDQLRAAYFDSKAEKDSEIVQRMTRSGCHYAASLMPKRSGRSCAPATRCLARYSRKDLPCCRTPVWQASCAVDLDR